MRLCAVITLMLFLQSAAAISGPETCKLPSWAKEENAARKCYCGSDLANIVVTLPAGLRLETVCDLSYYVAKENKYIEINIKKEKLLLDGNVSYQQGKYPDSGLVLLTGATQLTGVVVSEEGSTTDLWFQAKKIKNQPLFWESYLKYLSLGSDSDYKKFSAPHYYETGGETSCAEATITIHDPYVLFGDSPSSGMHADYDVLWVSDFKRCDQSSISNMIRVQW